MATSQQELDAIRVENEKKRQLINDEIQKAAELQRMVENDTTKAALAKEGANLDAELAKAKAHTAALEEVSGVSADSLKSRVTRSSTSVAPPVPPTGPAGASSANVVAPSTAASGEQK